MKNTKIISFFLILVLSIQLLPLKQMISWLLRNQVTEELVHNCDSGKAKTAPFDEIHKHFHESNNIGISRLFLNLSGSIHHDAVALIARHADDIHTPPPNC